MAAMQQSSLELIWQNTLETAYISVPVLGILLILSIWTWGMALHKWKVEKKQRAQNAEFLIAFKKVQNFDELGKVREMFKAGPLSGIGYRVLTSSENIPQVQSPESSDLRASILEEEIQSEIAEQIQKEKFGLTGLSITSTLAPFFGLLGTVMGILQTLLDVSRSGGQVDLQTIGPGIAAALVTTVAGLLTAIPASWFHRLFSGKITSNEVYYYNFGSRLLALFRRKDLSAFAQKESSAQQQSSEF